MAEVPIVLLAPRRERGDALADTAGVVLLTFDATLQTSHSSSSTKTKYRAEDRASYDQHVEPGENSLRMRAIITATPLWTAAAPGRVRAAIETLERLRLEATLLVVDTYAYRYTNMVLVKIDGDRRETTGQAIELDLVFEQARFAQVEVSKIPAEILAAVLRPGGQGKGETKDQPRDETDAEKAARDKTVFAGFDDLADGAFSALGRELIESAGGN